MTTQRDGHVTGPTTGPTTGRALGRTSAPDYILTLVCADRPGIVREVSDFLYRQDCDIAESQQYGEPTGGLFFMRVHVRSGADTPDATELRARFASVAAAFAMSWELHDRSARPRVLLMVSRFGHCLNDLLYRTRIGALPIEVPAIVSNHTDLAGLAAAHDIPFVHIPVSSDTKPEAEARLLDVVREYDIELVTLARYMQVLSAEVCKHLEGRAINIHHSFLPGFKGASPYQQAHTRGVKLIGATAHYVTADLDEGPIIEQDVVRVDHSLGPDDLAAVGREVECRVLARAVGWHAERRVLLNGGRTVVFR